MGIVEEKSILLGPNSWLSWWRFHSIQLFSVISDSKTMDGAMSEPTEFCSNSPLGESL